MNPLHNEDLSRGTVVGGRFEVQSKIGEGGMGSVYRATQDKLGRQVALKVIKRTYAAKKSARRRFEREARVAAALKHPNAVEIYDFGEHEDTLYLAMELLEGETLRAYVDEDKPPLSLRRAAKIGGDIADVLVSAERVGLTHRDLKPENVLLDRSHDGVERTVVVDFGLAFIQEDETSGRMTREGVVTGTPDYMSPEQARGTEITPSADVYALGCMLYEMLTAFPPFDGDAAVILSRHLFVAPAPIRNAFPELRVPGALDELILRMLSKAPEDRPSAQTVRDALRALDPDAPERTGGQSVDGRLLGRAARMVSQAPATSRHSERPVVTSARLSVATTQPVSDDFELALAANGISVVTFEADSTPRNAAAIFAPNASEQEVATLSASGLPVITDAESSDVTRLTAMLRAGAADIVIRPCAPDDVATKIVRAVKRASRS